MQAPTLPRGRLLQMLLLLTLRNVLGGAHDVGQGRLHSLPVDNVLLELAKLSRTIILEVASAARGSLIQGGVAVDPKEQILVLGGALPLTPAPGALVRTAIIILQLVHLINCFPH